MDEYRFENGTPFVEHRKLKFSELQPGHLTVQGLIKRVIPGGTDKFWGEKDAILFFDLHDAYQGGAYRSVKEDEEFEILYERGTPAYRHTVKLIIEERSSCRSNAESDMDFLQVLSRPDDSLEGIVERALNKFWNEIAQSYPGGKTGDVSPERIFELRNAAEKAVQEWLEFNRPNLCRKCGAEMKPGQALEQTYHEGKEGTCSPAGPGKMVDCLKCPSCGWSITNGS